MSNLINPTKPDINAALDKLERDLIMDEPDPYKLALVLRPGPRNESRLPPVVGPALWRGLLWGTGMSIVGFLVAAIAFGVAHALWDIWRVGR